MIPVFESTIIAGRDTHSDSKIKLIVIGQDFQVFRQFRTGQRRAIIPHGIDYRSAVSDFVSRCRRRHVCIDQHSLDKLKEKINGMA